jgi:hypothetical protein
MDNLQKKIPSKKQDALNVVKNTILPQIARTRKKNIPRRRRRVKARKFLKSITRRRKMVKHAMLSGIRMQAQAPTPMMRSHLKRVLPV